MKKGLRILGIVFHHAVIQRGKHIDARQGTTGMAASRSFEHADDVLPHLVRDDLHFKGIHKQPFILPVNTSGLYDHQRNNSAIFAERTYAAQCMGAQYAPNGTTLPN